MSNYILFVQSDEESTIRIAVSLSFQGFHIRLMAFAPHLHAVVGDPVGYCTSSPIHAVAETGRRALLQRLLELGFDAEAPHASGRPALALFRAALRLHRPGNLGKSGAPGRGRPPSPCIWAAHGDATSHPTGERLPGSGSEWPRACNAALGAPRSPLARV